MQDEIPCFHHYLLQCYLICTLIIRPSPPRQQTWLQEALMFLRLTWSFKVHIFHYVKFSSLKKEYHSLCPPPNSTWHTTFSSSTSSWTCHTVFVFFTSQLNPTCSISSVYLSVEPPPNGVDFYIHRAGRTGRKGKPGRAILLYSDRDRYFMREVCIVYLHNIRVYLVCVLGQWMQVQCRLYICRPMGCWVYPYFYTRKCYLKSQIFLTAILALYYWWGLKYSIQNVFFFFLKQHLLSTDGLPG